MTMENTLTPELPAIPPLPPEWVESKLPNEDGQEIGAGCPASDLFGPVPTFRRWEFALTLDTWALPLCITRFRCGAVQIQFLCFELHTSIAHRWPNTQFSDDLPQTSNNYD